MSEEASKVTIKLRRGDLEIEVTCTEDKIQSAIQSVLASLRQEISEQPYQYPTTSKARGMTCRGLITALWEEGWFSQERSLGEVHEELRRRGYNYDSTAVSHVLADLVRELILTRVGSARNYRYIQKRPFSAD